MMRTGTMRAVECTKYGPPEVLKLVEAPIPTPKDDELQLAVKASAVTDSDIFVRGSDLPFPLVVVMRLLIGFRRPRRSILGFVYSGVVTAVGSKITRFVPGDEVYGMTGFRFGAYAEYLCVRETDSKRGCVALKPKSVDFNEATAAAYGGALALQYADKGHIESGDDVLVYGASGTSGTIAVQYAKHLGARVTGVCSTRNLNLVRSLGADEVLDYTSTDEVPAGTTYDFVMDAVGRLKSSPLKKAARAALKDPKNYSSISDGDLILSSARLNQIAELIDRGMIKPVLDRVYRLSEIVDAHTYVQKGHKVGGVAISIPG